MRPWSIHVAWAIHHQDPNPSLSYPTGIKMEACPLDAAALLIIDMQQHFAPCAAPLVPRLNALAGAARGAGIPVIWTQHGHPDPATDAATSNLVRWWGADNSIKCGSEGASILFRLACARNTRTPLLQHCM